MPVKTCSSCGTEKPLSEFHIDKRRQVPYYQCKACINAKNRAWYQKNKHRASVKKRRRDYQLRYCFGIDLKEYNKLFKKQKGHCFICGIHQNKLAHTLHVDHNHETGEVRGLLCKSCNNKLGWVEKRKERIYPYLNLLENEQSANH